LDADQGPQGQHSTPIDIEEIIVRTDQDAYHGVVQVQAVIRSGRVVAVNVLVQYLDQPFHQPPGVAVARLGSNQRP
jgi:hypothetical protein